MKGILHTSRLVSHVGEECRELMSPGVVSPGGSKAVKCICRLDEHRVSVDAIGGLAVPFWEELIEDVPRDDGRDITIILLGVTHEHAVHQQSRKHGGGREPDSPLLVLHRIHKSEYVRNNDSVCKLVQL